MSSLADRLKQIRKENGITQSTLAKALNVSQNAVYNWENDKCEPNIETLKKISEFFNIPVTEFFGDTRIDIMTEFDVAKIEYMINQNQYKSTSVQEDDKDIAKDLENIMSRLANNENGPLSYDGEEIPDEERELFAAQLEIMLRRLKTINKQKYNPNKNKPNP